MRSGIVEFVPESLRSSIINRSKSAAARHGNVVDRHHGEAVPDPYRWLENLAGAETTALVRVQNEGTQAWLAAVAARAQIVVSLSRGRGPGAELRVLDHGHRRAGWRVLVRDTGDLAQVIIAETADRLAFLKGTFGRTPL